MHALIINVHAQESALFSEDTVHIERDGGLIYGSLIDLHKEDQTAVLIIAGSGPTDRNGNNYMMTNNSLKMLAHALAENGIASVRYDKRGVAASIPAGLSEIELRFEDYIKDAVAWIEFLKQDPGIKKIVVLGHSEGSLIGMVASTISRVDGIISLAGPGEPADLVLKRQLKSQPQFVQDQLFPKIDSLKQGLTIPEVDPAYFALLRPSVQPYLISWFKYDPREAIKMLDIPVLIIQGDTDIQVRVEDADLLKHAAPDARLHIIQGMNHVLKTASTDRTENVATYSNPDLPVVEELVEVIVSFINSIE